jgi:outer membrane lipoprotein-sorting protein
MSNREQPEDRLAEALAALRKSGPTAGPAEELLQRTIARWDAGDVKPVTTNKGWWTMKVVRRTALGTGLAAALMAVWIAFAVSGRLAFADVIEHVKAVKLMRCTTSTDVEISGQGKMTQTGTMIMSPTWMIMRTDNVKMIIDTDKGQMITLTETFHQALVMNLQKAPAGAAPVNILDSFRKFDPKASQPLGDMVINGKPARGFEVTMGNSKMKVWADLKTELPVRIESIGANPMMPDTKTVFTDFDWDPVVKPEEISLEIPKDYAITNVDASKPAEADISKMLTAWIELNDGKFPEKLNYVEMIRINAAKIAKQEAAETAGMTPEQKEQWAQKVTSTMMTQMMPMTRGIGFISDTTAGSEWHYAGNGATPGEKNHPILWYKPANTPTWRVFDADLTIHDAPQAPAGGSPVSLSIKDLNQAVHEVNPDTGTTSQPAPTPPVLPITPNAAHTQP